MSDAFKNFVVVAGAVVGAQLECDDTEDDVEDSQGGDSNQSDGTEGEEVLEQVLAAGQARADDHSHISEGNREVLF